MRTVQVILFFLFMLHRPLFFPPSFLILLEQSFSCSIQTHVTMLWVSPHELEMHCALAGFCRTARDL